MPRVDSAGYDSPARDAVARINQRVGRIGASPRPVPTRSRFATSGHAAELARVINGRGVGGGRGSQDYQFDAASGKGRLERLLARIDRELDEAVAAGTIDADDASEQRRKAHDAAEGLFGEKKSALDRVVDGGGSLLGGALRAISRPGQAILNATVERFRQGEENPLEIGPLKINAALAGLLLPTEGTNYSALLDEARAGWNLDPERMASPGDLGNDAAEIREKRGDGRGFFGSDVGDVATSPITNNVPTDLLVRAYTDPTSVVAFGTGSVARGALNSADEVIPGVAARLRRVGVAGLDDAERATLREALPERAYQALEDSAQGGIRARTPLGRGAEGRTVVPGDLLRAPLREAAADSPLLRRLAESRPGDALAGAGRTVKEAVIPRAAVRRLGGRAERAVDDARVAMTAGAASRTQRQIDRIVSIAREIPDLSTDEIRTVTRALDLDGDVEALEPRLRPLADAFGTWRQSLTDEQVAEGVLVGAEKRLLGLEAARDRRQGAVDALRARLAGLEEREAERIARFDPVNAERAMGRVDRDLTDAGYRGGRSDQRAIGLDRARTEALEGADDAAQRQADVRGRDWVEGPDVQAVDDLPTVRRSLTPEQIAAREARELRPIAREEAAAAREADRLRVRQGSEVRRAEAAADRAFEAQATLADRAARLSGASFDRGQRSVNAVRAIRKAQATVQREIKDAERALAKAEDDLARGVVADEDYFPRILTPDAIKVMTASEGGFKSTGSLGVRSNVAGDKFVTARKPEWAGMSIEQINAEMAPIMEAAREAGIVKHSRPIEWFDSNPFTAFAQRDAAARRHIVGKQFYERLLTLTDDTGAPLAQRVAELPEEVAAGLAKADGLSKGAAGDRQRIANELTGGDEWTFVQVPALGAGLRPEWMLVRNEIGDELTKVAGALAGADSKIVRFMDDWQNLWKSYATVPVPFGLGFHLRNAQGNVFLNWLDGLSSAAPYRRAFKLQRQISQGVKQFGDPFAVLDEADATIVREAMDRGVIGEGFFDVEVGREGGRYVRDSKGRAAYAGAGAGWNAANPFSTDNVLIAVGHRLGSAVENNARMAHFLWKLDQIGDPAEAARSVRRVLFDYSDVTPFEKGVIKRVVPFYTFLRKSAPTVAEAFLTNPSKLSRIQQVRMELAEDSADTEGLYPSWLSDSLGVPLPQGVSRALSRVPFLGADADTPLVLTPDLPLLAPSETLTDLLAITSALPGPNITDRSPSEGAQGILGMAAGGPVGALSTLAQVGLGRRFYNGSTLSDRPVHASLSALPFSRRRDVDGDGDLERSVSAKTDFALESLFPLASKIPFGTRGEEDKVPRRLLSMLSGVRVYPLGEATQEGEAWAVRDRLLRMLNDLYASGRVNEGNDAEEDD